MKKYAALLLALALLFALALPAAAVQESRDVTITYRSIRIGLDRGLIAPKDANGGDAEPFLLDGSTYLPVRAVAEALGLEVSWDGESNTVSLRRGGSAPLLSKEAAGHREDKTVTVTYRDIRILLDGEELSPKDTNGESTEPFLLDGSTYLPVRALAEALGLEVSWDGESSTVYLLTPLTPLDPKPELPPPDAGLNPPPNPVMGAPDTAG